MENENEISQKDGRLKKEGRQGGRKENEEW